MPVATAASRASFDPKSISVVTVVIPLSSANVALRVHEPRWWRYLAKRAGEAELAAVLVTPPAPPVIATHAHVHLAHRHRPSGRPEKPASHQGRFRICPVNQRPGCFKRSRDLDLALAG